ncbi:MAG: hypothetical protein ABIQ66_04840 [Novosphingobium sp.]
MFVSTRPRRIAAAAFWLALIFAVTMALLPHPPELAADKFGDKFHHVLAFSVLSALAATAFPRTPPWRMIEHLSFLGAMIEVAQAIPALHRDCDIRDWVADTIAVVVVTAIARWLRRSRRK